MGAAGALLLETQSVVVLVVKESPAHKFFSWSLMVGTLPVFELWRGYSLRIREGPLKARINVSVQEDICNGWPTLLGNEIQAIKGLRVTNT